MTFTPINSVNQDGGDGARQAALDDLVILIAHKLGLDPDNLVAGILQNYGTNNSVELLLAGIGAGIDHDRRVQNELATLRTQAQPGA